MDTLAPLVLDVPAIAKYLNTTVRAVRTLLNRGELAYKRLGHKFVVSMVELERWANSATREGEPRKRGAK